MNIRLSEQELLVEMRNRTRRGAEVLYDTYAPNLFKAIVSIVREKQLAENILEDTFKNVWFFYDEVEARHERLGLYMMSHARRLAKAAIKTALPEVENPLNNFLNL